ncbi:hypothetical protein K443DRAFT_684405 [Laccaria amethystina LaAM-08-1]|uniref:Uncharacterized protein n=1 Tax=Laccaria amethystina LaAM-08-1 TaxID=1095629 RepID=A0A0C9WQV4_9AGAR|nr:hypothetical protein K443DRAFT_684405 [Laccaria amethystina LaAM-08-1]
MVTTRIKHTDKYATKTGIPIFSLSTLNANTCTWFLLYHTWLEFQTGKHDVKGDQRTVGSQM